MESILNIITSSLPAFLTGVLGPILILIVRHYLQEHKKTKDPIKDAAANGEIICKVLDQILDETGLDRVWITQFHNGGHFYPTGKSIQKFSMIYEAVTAEAESIRHNFQNIPINLFSKSINRLLDHDKITITDYKNEEIATYGLRYLAEETNCKSSYMFALKNIDGKMIGVLSAESIKRKKELSDEAYDSLKTHAAQIGVLLDTFIRKK
jgi:hypothetical protein